MLKDLLDKAPQSKDLKLMKVGSFFFHGRASTPASARASDARRDGRGTGSVQCTAIIWRQAALWFSMECVRDRLRHGHTLINGRIVLYGMC